MKYETFGRRRGAATPQRGPHPDMKPLGDCTLSQLLLIAAADVGSDGRGKGGVFGYLRSLATNHPRKFGELLRGSKLLLEKQRFDLFPKTWREFRREHCLMHAMTPDEFEKAWNALYPLDGYLLTERTQDQIEEELQKYEETHDEPGGHRPRRRREPIVIEREPPSGDDD